MGSNLLNKVLDTFGLGDDDYDMLENNDYDEERLEVITGAKDKKNNVVGIQSKANTKIIVCTIDGFDEVTKYCDYLKEDKLVIMDCKNVDSEMAQRCVDFLAGALYAMNGYMQEISPGMLLLAPSSVEVSSDIKDKLMDSGMLSLVYKNNH